jgi:hypothetical protein
MFLSVVLFVLFVAGCWLYCLTDAVLTPAAEFRGLPKPAWVALIALTFILGTVAWVIARLWWRARRRPHPSAVRPEPVGFDVPNVRWDPPPAAVADEFPPAEALIRHPASGPSGRTGRTCPIGPDDDPEFLRMLDRLISGSPDSGELPGFHPHVRSPAFPANVSGRAAAPGQEDPACRPRVL